MKNKRNLILILLIFMVTVAGASVLYDRLGQNAAAEQLVVHNTMEPGADSAEAAADDPADVPGEEGSESVSAPDFTVYDKEGNAVKLSDFFGKPIVLNFWASWCGPCQYEMPDFDEKYREFGDDVHFLMINMTDGQRETVETASAFIEQNGYRFPVLYDTQSAAALTYGAYSLPTSFFIDAEGYVIAQAVGAISAETLQIGIDAITSAGAGEL